MQLTLHADYAFRVLLYLGSQPAGHVAATKDISRSYGISKHHLVRVVQTLSEHGYVAVNPGRAGGVSLAREADQIKLGDVMRNAETNLQVVECFNHAVSDFTQLARKHGLAIVDINEYFDNNDRNEIPRILVILLRKS